MSSSPSKTRAGARISTGGRPPRKVDPAPEVTALSETAPVVGMPLNFAAADPAASAPPPSLGKHALDPEGDEDAPSSGSGAPSPTKKSRSDGAPVDDQGPPASQSLSAGVAAKLFGSIAPTGDPVSNTTDSTPGLGYDVEGMDRVALTVFADRQQRSIWSSVYRDGKGLVRAMRARPETCGVTVAEDFDVALKEKGLYDNMPFLPPFQATGYGNIPHDADVDDATGRVMLPSVDMSVWEPYKFDDGYIEGIVSYTSSKDRVYVNPSRADPVHYAAKETWSKDWNGQNFAIVNRSTLEPVTLVSLGVCMSSHIVTPKSGDKGPTYKALMLLGHRVEHERQLAFIASVFQEDGLHMQVSRSNNVVTYQTKFMPNKAQGLSSSSVPTTQIGGLRLSSAPSSPTKKSASSTPQPKWNGGYEWSAQIPIYDCRRSNFDIDDINYSISCLRESGSIWNPLDEVNPGACVLVGYGAHSNYWGGNWRCSLYIKWAVVLAA